MFDERSPCRRDCPDRPNCKGCVRGNEFRALKNRESKERYLNNGFNRYECDRVNTIIDTIVKNKRKPKRHTRHD